MTDVSCRAVQDSGVVGLIDRPCCGNRFFFSGTERSTRQKELLIHGRYMARRLETIFRNENCFEESSRALIPLRSSRVQQPRSFLSHHQCCLYYYSSSVTGIPKSCQKKQKVWHGFHTKRKWTGYWFQQQTPNQKVRILASMVSMFHSDTLFVPDTASCSQTALSGTVA